MSRPGLTTQRGRAHKNDLHLSSADASRSDVMTDGRALSVLFVVILGVIAAVSSVVSDPSSTRPMGSAYWALDLLDDLVVSDAGAPASHPYDRDEYGRWLDADGDCQSARHEVLAVESIEAVLYQDGAACKVVSGRWQDPYSTELTTDVTDASIDHVVALSEAHHAGAWQWDTRWKRAHFNDVDDPATLAVSLVSVNQSKGARGPQEWLPNDADRRCSYLVARVRVKTRWQLSLTTVEEMTTRQELRQCAIHNLPAIPETALLEIINFQEQPTIAQRPTPAVTPGSCDDRYEAVCIPLAAGDLDCSDIAPRHFFVGELDPHGFDGNGDGVGCEGLR